MLVKYSEAGGVEVGISKTFDGKHPPLNRGVDTLTTATVNPGVLWSGQYYQVGVEAILPINSHTAHNVGVIAQIHFYPGTNRDDSSNVRDTVLESSLTWRS